MLASITRGVLLLLLWISAGSAVAQVVVATGITRPRHDVRLSLPVAGRIESVHVTEGQRVKKGAVLLQLDKAAESLEVARRKLLLEDHSRLTELRSKEAVLARQVAAARGLLSLNAISRKNVEDEEIAYAEATAQRTSLEVTKLREQVEYDQAVEALARRTLHAPMDGIVTRITLRVGESLSPNDPVVGMVDISRVRFVGTLPTGAALGVRVQTAGKVVLAGNGYNITRQAQVVFVSPVTDPASGLVEVIAEFNNFDGSVSPGMTGELHIRKR
jgi:membrane fusion protein, multidrug efflux system